MHVSYSLPRWRCAGASEKKKTVRIFQPTGDEDKPYRILRMVGTQKDFVDTFSRCGVMSFFPVSDCPADPAAVNLEELDLPFIGSLDLQDGGNYIALGLDLPHEKQVGTHRHVQTLT